MAHRIFKHKCPNHGNTTVWTGSPVCRSCGAAAEYDGWGFSMVEEMGRYPAFYGLKPRGRHRNLARELFRDVKVRCEACEGRGLRDVADGFGYEKCSECNSHGFLFTRPPAEIEAIRQRVLDVYPDAAAPPSSMPGPRFLVERDGESGGRDSGNG